MDLIWWWCRRSLGIKHEQCYGRQQIANIDQWWQNKTWKVLQNVVWSRWPSICITSYNQSMWYGLCRFKKLRLWAILAQMDVKIHKKQIKIRLIHNNYELNISKIHSNSDGKNIRRSRSWLKRKTIIIWSSKNKLERHCPINKNIRLPFEYLKPSRPR